MADVASEDIVKPRSPRRATPRREGPRHTLPELLPSRRGSTWGGLQLPNLLSPRRRVVSDSSPERPAPTSPSTAAPAQGNKTTSPRSPDARRRYRILFSMAAMSVLARKKSLPTPSSQQVPAPSIKRDSLPATTLMRMLVRSDRAFRQQARKSQGDIALNEKREFLRAKFRMWAWVVFAVTSIWRRRRYHDRLDHSSPLYPLMEEIEKLLKENVDSDHYVFFDPSDYKANRQMRMSHEAKRILTKPAESRTEEEIYYAMIALRSIPIIADFPVRMQRNLAQYGVFECYDPKVIVVKQGHRPKAYYFILYGTVQVAVQPDHLARAKTVVTLGRGETFGELAIINKSERQSTVIAQSYVEMLAISDETYEKIFMVGGMRTILDPDQNEFLQSLEYLQGWPIHLFSATDTQNVRFSYFRRNQVIVKDSNFSDWIFIVKSGSLRVLKKLIKVKATISKRTGLPLPVRDIQGYGAFLDPTAQGRNRLTAEISCSDVVYSSHVTSDKSDSSEVESQNGSVQDEDDPVRQVRLVNRPHTSAAARSRAPGWRAALHTLSAISRLQHEAHKHRGSVITQLSQDGTVKQGAKSARSRRETTLKVHNKKRTFIDDIEVAYRARENILTAADINPQFVFVQTLTKGEAFGMAQMLFPEQPSLCVVSNGAECLMLSKKFYMENCDQELLHRIKTTVSPYPSDSKLQHDLMTCINWQAYKKVVRRQIDETRPQRVH